MSEWWVDESQLKGNQSDVLDVELDRDLGIFGPPGSGKTNLMMLRANHLHIAENPEFYVVTYTALLAQFMRRGASQYAFPVNKIITQTKLFETVLGDHGKSIPRIQGETFIQYQDRLFDAMTSLLDSGKGLQSYPALFIDEGQDYSPKQLQVFKKLSKNITIAADVRQGIYAAEDGLQDYIHKYCDPVITLIHHFRTGRNILKVADKIMNGKFDHVSMVDTSQYPEDTNKSTVDVEDSCSLEEQTDKAISRLVKQLMFFPEDLLGVLIPRTAELDLVWERMKNAPGLSGKVTNTRNIDFDPSKPIWISTIHAAKGLEFRCVHILSAENISRFNEKARRLAFTGVTRAKTSLAIYHHTELLPFLAAALKPGKVEGVKRHQLFGQKP